MVISYLFDKLIVKFSTYILNDLPRRNVSKGKKEDPLHKVFRHKQSRHSLLLGTVVYSPLLAVYKDITNYKRDGLKGKRVKAHNHAIGEKKLQ